MRIEKTVTMATTYEEVETDTHIAMGVSDKSGPSGVSVTWCQL